MIHNQFFNYVAKQHSPQKHFLNKLSNSIYLLSIKEWNLDNFLKIALWNPFKIIGKKFQFLSNKIGIIFLSVFFIANLLLFLFNKNNLPKQINQYLHMLFALVGTIMVLLAFIEKKDALKAWLLIILSQFYVVLSIALLNNKYEYTEILIYLCGLIFAAVLGIIILQKLKSKQIKLSLNGFSGHVYHHKHLTFWFLIACLAFVGLPFTPSFIGIDLMFSHIDHDEYILIALTSVSFLVLELSILRIYARIFLGPHKSQTHPIAYRSS